MPPVDETRQRPSRLPKMMVPSSPQLPPRPFPTSQIVAGSPPSRDHFLGHPVNGEVGTWFGAFRIPNLVPRSLVNIVGCSSRGRGNCGKLRATSNWASKPVIRSFPSAVRTVEKQLRALASSPPELVVFPTVCIVRQFPRPAFDWRHLPIYRMNPFFQVALTRQTSEKAHPLPVGRKNGAQPPSVPGIVLASS